MGGDDSQKLLPWRGACYSPGRSNQVKCIMMACPNGGSSASAPFFEVRSRTPK